MSEEAKESPKKKGKLPVIIALVVALAAGGFFGMKMKGGAAKKPEIKLGSTETLGEFLLNLNDAGQVYLRTEIALQFQDGFKKEELEKSLPAIKDTVLQVLRSKSIAQVSARNTPKLKAEIAEAVNKLLEASEPKHEEAKGSHPDPKADAKEKEAPKHENWDSQAGPVLKVYFTSFATQ